MTYIKRTYAALGRASHAAITPILKKYMTENHARVRVLILNDEDEVLLVRSWLGHQKWSLPGGGVKRAERPEEAASREVFEETGLRIAADHLTPLGSFTTESAKYKFTIICYVIKIARRDPSVRHHRRLETLDISWFNLKHLPEAISQNVAKALALYCKK